MRDRVINPNDTVGEHRIFPDSYFTNKLIVIDAVRVPQGLRINQYDFGSMASINKIVPPAVSYFIQFAIPPHTSIFKPQGAFEWVFLNSDTNKTDIMALHPSKGAPNNLKAHFFTVPGNQQMLALG